jgi:hypothetical protein
LIGPLTPDGPLVDVLLGLSSTEIMRLRYAGQAVPQAVQMRALLDTGSACTCADVGALTTLTLPIVGFCFINAPALGGLGVAPQHDAGLTVLHPSGRPKDNWILKDLPVADLQLGALGYDMLIGRDVLDQGALLYNVPPGQFTLTY